MSEMIEVDEQTFRSLQLAARVSGSTSGAIVARLVAEASMATPDEDEKGGAVEDAVGVVVRADYGGFRTHGRYDTVTSRIDITDGPLAGKSFKTPTGAARAVVKNYSPDVSPNRNGWSFWLIDDGQGAALQSIRHGARPAGCDSTDVAEA